MYRKIRNTFLLAVMLLAPLLVWAEVVETGEGGKASQWKLVTDKQGVQVYWLNSEDSRRHPNHGG